MAFNGTLKEFKVPDILQLISLQKKTGILTFRDDGFITIVFEDGYIVGVDAFPKKLELRVGYVLVKQDVISEEMIQRALSIQKRTGQKIGETLLSMGIVNKERINEALKTQVVQIILSLFKWKRGEYNFKVLDTIEPSLKIIEPIPTDNIIMEGVQMLDEWPLIKKVISNDSIVFEPIEVNNKKIEIVDELEEEITESSDSIYLTESESQLLKYINGQNTVKDIVEMGILTEYKVYKNIYNLLNKGVIRKKDKSVSQEVKLQELLVQTKENSKKRFNLIYNIVIVALIILFFLTLFTPIRPFQSDNLLIDSQLINQAKEISNIK